MSHGSATRRVRIPGTSRLAEGEAKKILVPAATRGAAPFELLLVRLDGRLHALDSLCPHEGGRLAEGPLWEGGTVHCPLHLYRFDPRTGAAVDVECEPARTFPVREVDGVAELELPLDEPEGRS
jgi:nitrite reductase/ring-hydroxylating ferredoxin subunit